MSFEELKSFQIEPKSTKGGGGEIRRMDSIILHTMNLIRWSTIEYYEVHSARNCKLTEQFS